MRNNPASQILDRRSPDGFQRKMKASPFSKRALLLLSLTVAASTGHWSSAQVPDDPGPSHYGQRMGTGTLPKRKLTTGGDRRDSDGAIAPSITPNSKPRTPRFPFKGSIRISPIDFEIPEKQELIPVRFDSVQVSDHFSEGSDVTGTVEGVFGNGCDRWSGIDVSPFRSQELIEVRFYAVQTADLCAQEQGAPFAKTITLGKLPKGTYAVRFFQPNGDYTEKPLFIE